MGDRGAPGADGPATASAAKGRIAHLKREYGAGRSRLKGESGARIWQGWAVFAYDVDTAAALPINTS